MISAPLIARGGRHRAAMPRHLAGGKASNLGRLQSTDQPVPSFYVITTEAFRLALFTNQADDPFDDLATRLNSHDELVQIEAAEIMDERIRGLRLPPELEKDIRETHAATFAPDAVCAVRSSAVREDDTHHSFAGMYDSELAVIGVDNIIAAVKRVWASAFSDRARAYCQPIAATAMAVVVQEMIDANHSGVLFTCNPINGDSQQMLINTSAGSGPPLVDGNIRAETYHVDKETLTIHECTANQENAVPFRGNGSPTSKREIHRNDKPSNRLTEEQIRAASASAVAIEGLFGHPQDIEFCFGRDDRLFILQTRPVTRTSARSTQAGNHLIWDNSNIIESYSGVTSPMTFSFIRRAYSIVYHCFAEVMGIRPAVIRAHHDAFDNMLGIFRGRIYYNLKNWYRLVHLFPGYQYNRQFMESMMGLKEPLLGEASSPVGFWRRWLIELPALLGLLARSTWNFLRIHKIVDRFQHDFERRYSEWSRIDFRELPPHEVMGLYRKMEDAMLWNWKAPIINDFFVMVFYGTLRKLCVVWCGDEGSLQNGLLCGDGGLESAEPAKWLLHLSKMATDTPELKQLICTVPVEELPSGSHEIQDSRSSVSRWTSFSIAMDSAASTN